jgi:putative aldouronate transport system permease protein
MAAESVPERVTAGAGAQVRRLPAERSRRSFAATLRRMWFYRYVYLLMAPGLLYFFVFCYVPMWGVVIAFQDFHLWQGVLGSPWVGLDNFSTFFQSTYFVRLMRNTLVISFLNLIFVFPAPILLALMLNEVRSDRYKRVIQTVSYLPYFISWVVVWGLLIYMFSVNVGFLTGLLGALGLPPLQILGSEGALYPLIVGSAIWKDVGFAAIIFLAAIAGINPELYEAAVVDGANRFQRIRYVTLPGITEVIVIMLILQIGAILSVNFQQILVLVGNDASLYEAGDVIDTWVYRVGFFQQEMSLATAVGLFKGLIGLVLVLGANRLSRRVTESGLW